MTNRDFGVSIALICANQGRYWLHLESINYLEAELSRYYLKTISLAGKLRGTNPSEIR